MTNEEQGAAWVAEPGWRWLPGMRALHRWTGGIRINATEEGEQDCAYWVEPGPDGNEVITLSEGGVMGSFPDAGSAYPFLPDVTDPCTVGGLLALVEEAQEAIESQARERPAPVEHVYWINMVRTALQFWLHDGDMIPLLDAWQHAPGHSRWDV